MNQAKIANLVCQLRYNVLPKPRKLKNVKGPEGRSIKLQKTLTKLLKYERIELNLNRADETRGYVEQLISQAIRNGCQNKTVMELANFWILEKQLIYKLFNVFVPRYKSYCTSFTRIYNCPRDYPGSYRKKVVLELKGNPYPSIYTHSSDGNLLQNVLLSEAKKQYHIKHYEKFI
ncbi:PREDICTED: 39S ribosomal protein L17, mitochondrial [Ceratosolen solmsi marchali]|uniref:Large ribosomal subunit protein bL17m n=1 Tax=Ceratosolen solmsi marchali TaxID=326594 RepID=A0AAJ6YDX1_9HYME|nr:PREDICTED: 39S ribosomal protein L17, mitochondrial [Ceratosolen solmsi marchali]